MTAADCVNSDTTTVWTRWWSATRFEYLAPRLVESDNHPGRLASSSSSCTSLNFCCFLQACKWIRDRTEIITWSSGIYSSGLEVRVRENAELGADGITWRDSGFHFPGPSTRFAIRELAIAVTWVLSEWHTQTTSRSCMRRILVQTLQSTEINGI